MAAGFGLGAVDGVPFSPRISLVTVPLTVHITLVSENRSQLSVRIWIELVVLCAGACRAPPFRLVSSYRLDQVL